MTLWPEWNDDIEGKHPARTYPNFDCLESELLHAVQQGQIRRIDHDGASLYCYTRDTVFNKDWCTITELSRGLIVDHQERQILATPFPKFFNLGERITSIPDLPFQVFEKLDGSLIIIYSHNGKWKAATKGSLNSEQAQWAQHQLDSLPRDKFLHLYPGCTYLCEAIYRKNKIVIRYDYEGLVLLGAYNNAGREIAYQNLQLIANDMGWRIANRRSFENVSDLVAHAKQLPMNEEGFVLLFSNGLRLKIKGDAYCRVHRLISGCTPLALWESMLHQQDLREIRRDLPEEFWPDFDKIIGTLAIRIGTFMHQVATAVHSVQWDAEVTDKELGITLHRRFPRPVADFVFALRKKGDLLPPCDSSKKNPVPSLRRAVFNVFRPTANQLQGYEPTSSMARIQEDISSS